MAVPRPYRGGDWPLVLPRANLPADYVPGDDAFYALRGSAANWRVILKATALGNALLGTEMSSEATQLAVKHAIILPWSVDLSPVATTVSNGVLLLRRASFIPWA